jgi:DNA-binding transcriptional LysR family regulator
MRINQFEFLVALEKHKSFSKASKVLLISQPSISRAIKELEDELGITILNRGKSGIEFTSVGELLLERAKNIIFNLEGIKDISTTHSENKFRQEITVGASSHFCSFIMYEVLTSLKKDYPDLFIQITKNDYQTLMEDIGIKKVDIGIVQFNSMDESNFYFLLNEKKLKFIELFNEEMTFIVRESHPLAYKSKITLGEVLQYPYVTSKKSSIKHLLMFFKELGFKNEIVQITDIGILRRFIKTSNATCLIPKSAAKESNLIFEDKLVSLSIIDYELSSKMGWIHNQNPLSQIENIIINELTQYCYQYSSKGLENGDQKRLR